MTFLWEVLLLLQLLPAQASTQLIESCVDLKTTIEGATLTPDSAPLALQLRSDTLYRCEESIRVRAAQSVVVTAGDGLPAVVVASLSGRSPTHRPSLFVNEGSLELSNIRVELHAAAEGAGKVDRRSRRRKDERHQQQPAACHTGVGLIRNSGYAVVEGSHVFEEESGPRTPAVSRRSCGEKGARHGRVVSVRVERGREQGTTTVEAMAVA